MRSCHLRVCRNTVMQACPRVVRRSRAHSRTALPQLTHQDVTYAREDQVHGAALTTAVPDLTFAHAQMLPAVLMEA